MNPTTKETTNNGSVNQITFDVVRGFNTGSPEFPNIHDYYTMVIKAWKLPQIAGDLDKVLNSDDNQASIFKDGIAEYLLSELEDGAKSTFEFVKDGINYAAENGLSDVAGALLKNTNEAIKEFLDKLGEYTDGVDPVKNVKAKNFEASFTFPVPQNLTDTLRHQYDQDTFTPMESLKNLGSHLSRKIIQGEGINRIKDSMVEFTVNQAKRNNFVFDNNLINIYKQTEQREFIFNITLIPQSYQHYVEIVRAYSKLKILMTGDKIFANMAFTQKYCFTVSFPNKYFKSYMMLDDTVDLNLETLEIDVSGNPYTSFDAVSDNPYQGAGVPKLIQLILTFRERRPLRNDEHIDNLIGYKKEQSNEAQTTK